MPCENSARKRSKTMAFRCTPEEYELIANMAAWSGMSRQDYWIGYIFLDDLGRTKPAFLNSTGVMYPSVECILKLLYQCT